MQYLKPTAIIVAALFAAGCQMTLPVTGSISKNERFSGSATGYMDGSGKLTIKTERGLSCTGRFQYESRVKGAGSFSCKNGEKGKFRFTSRGDSGEGSGRSNRGRRFSFKFGG